MPRPSNATVVSAPCSYPRGSANKPLSRHVRPPSKLANVPGKSDSRPELELTGADQILSVSWIDSRIGLDVASKAVVCDHDVDRLMRYHAAGHMAGWPGVLGSRCAAGQCESGEDASDEAPASSLSEARDDHVSSSTLESMKAPKGRTGAVDKSSARTLVFLITGAENRWHSPSRTRIGYTRRQRSWREPPPRDGGDSLSGMRSSARPTT